MPINTWAHGDKRQMDMTFPNGALHLPTSVLHYVDHSKPQVTPVPVRALKRLAKFLPYTALHNIALGTINLAGDLVSGNRVLRGEQVYRRRRSRRTEELMQAMEQV
jgi:hypothetical protein